MTGKDPQGKRVLVVDDSNLMAETICDFLIDHGMEPVGPAPTVEEALSLIRDGNLDAALLDVTLDGETVFPVCEPLAARCIPFAFLTGTVEPLPEKFSSTPIIAKPYKRDDFLKALKALLKQS
jgi:DNA-binding response OmpR family regulator